MTSVIFFLFTYYLKYRTNKQEKLKQEYIKYRDTSKEFSIELEQKNKELLEKQDYEINIATLNERNRIAMEIHDNVGHLLSSSILQIGAILATTQDNTLTKNLETVNHTLSTAMDSIRNSVHNIHNDALQLTPQIQSIVDQFTFCEISLDNTITNNPNSKITYCFISIVKEALANIMKHSNADMVSITLREHPKLYQLKIQDNGSSVISDFDNGIGIKNMEHRVSSLNGNLTIHPQNGFTIFISIPKED